MLIRARNRTERINHRLDSTNFSIKAEKVKIKFSLFHKKEKAPKRKSKSPWSLHIGSFWKTHFINPPEVHGRWLVCSSMGRTKTRPKYQNPLFRSTVKLHRSCHDQHCQILAR
jgi:hypothetical protein